MASMNLKPLPIGVHSWIELKDKLFVDKTAKVTDLIIQQSKVYLCRPNHFGKTTLLSIVTDLFLYGDKNFVGKALHGQWPYDYSYKVLNISFSGIKINNTIGQISSFNHANLEREICSRVKQADTKSGYGNVSGKTLSDCTSFDDLFPAIARWCGGERLVLLVDDWDEPFKDLNNTQYSKRIANDVLTSFFSLVRAIQPNYMLVTGTTYYNEAASVLGDKLFNLNGTPYYDDLLGFTQRELEDNFGPYISEAAQRLGISDVALLNQLKQYYRNYSFDVQTQTQTQTELYCPQAINAFFNQLVTSQEPPKFLDFKSVN